MKMSKVFPDFNKMAGQNNRLPGHQQVSNAPRLAGLFPVGFFAQQLGNDAEGLHFDLDLREFQFFADDRVQSDVH